MKLEDEINQSTFNDEYQKVHLNIIFTAAWLNQLASKELKAFNISRQQFNILRILRGRHPEPATIKLLGERMIDRMSNASRLVEKLKQKGLVERLHCPVDRRKVDILITEEGLKLVNTASGVIDDFTTRLGKKLLKKDAKLLNELLDKLRE